jgi:sec-independent protein translocase protein TatB
MFNLGFWEMVVLAGIALIVVGPEKLPGLARSIGKFVNDLKRTTNTIASDITDAVDEENFLNSDKAKKQKKEESLEAAAETEEEENIVDNKKITDEATKGEHDHS